MLVHNRTEKGIKTFLNNPGSGLIIVGQPGAGKDHVAQHIAKKLLAVSSVVNHPHVHFLDASGADGSIDAVRELRKKINLVVPGNSSVRRVVIISHFDALGHEAQNAMLKTLEEPPVGTVFLLTADHEDRVLPTIHSRVHRLDVMPMSIKSAKEFTPDYDTRLVEQSYRISDGAAGLFTNLINGDTEHPMTVAIQEAKRVLLLPKHVQIASVDTIVKNKLITTSDFLDGMFRILVASHKLQLNGTDYRKQMNSQRRVKLVLRAIKDIKDGVSQKLVMTQLFLEL